MSLAWARCGSLGVAGSRWVSLKLAKLAKLAKTRKGSVKLGKTLFLQLVGQFVFCLLVNKSCSKLPVQDFKSPKGLPKQNKKNHIFIHGNLRICVSFFFY
jgi:hypothetical protein